MHIPVEDFVALPSVRHLAPLPVDPDWMCMISQLNAEEVRNMAHASDGFHYEARSLQKWLIQQNKMGAQTNCVIPGKSITSVEFRTMSRSECMATFIKYSKQFNMVLKWWGLAKPYFRKVIRYLHKCASHKIHIHIRISTQRRKSPEPFPPPTPDPPPAQTLESAPAQAPDSAKLPEYSLPSQLTACTQVHRRNAPIRRCQTLQVSPNSAFVPFRRGIHKR